MMCALKFSVQGGDVFDPSSYIHISEKSISLVNKLKSIAFFSAESSLVNRSSKASKNVFKNGFSVFPAEKSKKTMRTALSQFS